MAVTAWKAGLQTLGFSGHSHTPCDLEYCMTQSRTALYKAQIAKLKERYAGKNGHPVRVGMGSFQ